MAPLLKQMCVLFSLSGLFLSVGSIFWKKEYLLDLMSGQGCICYTIGHFLFSYHYYTVAISARFIVENGPEAHASKFKQGKFSIFACVVQAILIEVGLILQSLY